jgi:hypothetical protein
VVIRYKNVPEIKEKISVAVPIIWYKITTEPLQYKQELLNEEANITVQAFL